MQSLNINAFYYMYLYALRVLSKEDPYSRRWNNHIVIKGYLVDIKHYDYSKMYTFPLYPKALFGMYIYM